MPLVQDQSLNLLIYSPALCYGCSQQQTWNFWYISANCLRHTALLTHLLWHICCDTSALTHLVLNDVSGITSLVTVVTRAHRAPSGHSTKSTLCSSTSEVLCVFLFSSHNYSAIHLFYDIRVQTPRKQLQSDSQHSQFFSAFLSQFTQNHSMYVTANSS